MFSLLRPANLLVLVTYLALSAVPFIPFLSGGTAAHPARLAGLELFAWVAAWAVFKRPAWFHWMLIPAFFALPVELYLRTYYGQGISTHRLGVIAETSPKEALEFLGSVVWLLLAIALGISAWAWLTWKAACRTRDLDWVGKSHWVILGLLAIVLCTWFYDCEFGVRAADPPSASYTLTNTSATAPGTKDENDGEPVIASAPPGRSPTLPKLPDWARMPFDSDSFGTTWPFGLAVQGYDFWKERTYLSDLAQKSRLFKFGARQASQAESPQVVVMVIGESSRYDRWSLNGYKRETNPLLKNEPNLISLSNVVTATTIRSCTPTGFCRKSSLH